MPLFRDRSKYDNGNAHRLTQTRPRSIFSVLAPVARKQKSSRNVEERGNGLCRLATRMMEPHDWPPVQSVLWVFASSASSPYPLLALIMIRGMTYEWRYVRRGVHAEEGNKKKYFY